MSCAVTLSARATRCCTCATPSASRGDAFLRALEACFGRIVRHPESHVVAQARVRRARLHRFPYGVYYTIREDFIDILAVYHGRRRPRRFDP